MKVDANNLPLIAIMVPFITALTFLIPGKSLLFIKRLISVVAVLVSLFCLTLLFKPIFLDKLISHYWMNGWEPVKFWAFGIGLEVDSLGLFFGLIIVMTFFICGIYLMTDTIKEDIVQTYYILFLLLFGSALGFVFTGDLINMYIMLEIMIFAAVGLITYKSSVDKYIDAGFKYIVISSLGSSLILLGTVLLYTQVHTLNLAQIATIMHVEKFTPVTTFAFALMLVGYAVKVLLVPCHSWFLNVHMVIPAYVSILITGTISSIGIYAFIRIIYLVYQCMDLTQIVFLVVSWGTIAMLFGALMAIIQKDIKRMLFYFSVSQIGYIILGLGIGLARDKFLATDGVIGGLYHLFNYVVFNFLLFICADAICHCTGTTDLNKLSGIFKKMPFTLIMFLIGAASLTGIPPFNGFISKWLIYEATTKMGNVPVTITVLLASILTFLAFTNIIKSLFTGELSKENYDVKEIPYLMRIPMVILSFICLLGGVASTYISKYFIEPAVYSIFNISNYVDVMFIEGYANKMFKTKVQIQNIEPISSVYSNPNAWIVFFFMLLIIIIIITSMKKIASMKKDILFVDELEKESGNNIVKGKRELSLIYVRNGIYVLIQKLSLYFDNYEKDSYQKVNGILVNDYVLYILTCLAVVTAYLFASM